MTTSKIGKNLNNTDGLHQYHVKLQFYKMSPLGETGQSTQAIKAQQEARL